jgi:hypothetical protein
MSEEQIFQALLGQALSRLARPYRCDEALPADVQANLWRLGFPCNERTPREDLIAELWARKRQMSPAFRAASAQDWPPTAA